jgi:hypothetical protein
MLKFATEYEASGRVLHGVVSHTCVDRSGSAAPNRYQRRLRSGSFSVNPSLRCPLPFLIERSRRLARHAGDGK